MASDGLNRIEHYQNAIKRAGNDEKKLLYCVGKLFDLQITIEHLQKTGVGKTVNSLRKYKGEVGKVAKALVTKWKTMVAVKDSSQNHLDDTDGNVSALNKFNENVLPDCSKKFHSSNISLVDTADKRTHHSTSPNYEDVYQNNEHHKTTAIPKVQEKGRRTNKSENFVSDEIFSTGNGSPTSHKRKKQKEVTDEIFATGNVSPASHKRKKQKEVSSSTNNPKKTKLIDNQGIDSSMGASFSDALGMCGIPSGKNKKNQKKSTTTKVKEKIHDPKEIPEALKTVPKGNLDISSHLPVPVAPSMVTISQNYKPAPIDPNYINSLYSSTTTNHKKVPTVTLDYNIGITSKTARTKIYSGVKTGAILLVPSLFDICIRVLQKNIDALGYTGGVPFDVLRPVLERTTPQQLLTFEDYNSYLLEDTDELWKLHVGRIFRGKTRDDGESWRELFLRCEDEKERRLSILTRNIKISQKQSALPVRKTRLAYVDNVVKPPRNVQRKQELYGTNDKLTVSPAARVAALSSSIPNTALAGDPRLRNMRHIEPQTNSMRTKKAPLMAKTLQFIKKTYKK